MRDEDIGNIVKDDDGEVIALVCKNCEIQALRSQLAAAQKNESRV